MEGNPKVTASRTAASAIPAASKDEEKSLDVKNIRDRARHNIEKGAITESYTANREEVVKLLNAALATELVCWLRYKRHQLMASGIHAEPVAAEFAEHAQEEQEHAEWIAERIVEIGGEPNFNPDGLSSRSHSEYIEGKDLRSMIKENLIAERIAIDSYREMVRQLGDRDPTTRRLMEKILAVEEEHAKDMVDLLDFGHGVGPAGSGQSN